MKVVFFSVLIVVFLVLSCATDMSSGRQTYDKFVEDLTKNEKEMYYGAYLKCFRSIEKEYWIKFYRSTFAKKFKVKRLLKKFASLRREYKRRVTVLKKQKKDLKSDSKLKRISRLQRETFIEAGDLMLEKTVEFCARRVKMGNSLRLRVIKVIREYHNPENRKYYNNKEREYYKLKKIDV